MQSEPLPECVRRLFWDVDPDTVDFERHRDYVMERVMTRGTWDAMRWLRGRYSLQEMAEFLGRKAARLTPRDRAYWSLISGRSAPQEPGGGRPAWTG